MEFNYNVTGERRKALVTTISEVLDMKAVYKGMPTAAYAIDNLTVLLEWVSPKQSARSSGKC